MNDNRYRWTLYTIVVVILTTIGIQVYWNFKNYQTNKQQLANTIQTSLDKAVDDYYTNLAEETTLGLSLFGETQKNAFDEGGVLERITAQIDESKQHFKNIEIDSMEGVTILRGFKADSMMKAQRNKHPSVSIDSFTKHLDIIRQEDDSTQFSDFEFLTSKVVISISNDSLDLKEIDSLMKVELLRKNISVDYKIHYLNPKDSIYDVKEFKEIVDNEAIKNGKVLLTTFTKSAYLPDNCQLGITYTNQTMLILKRILGGILISTLLVLAVIRCLFYLLNIIKHQKQLAEVKNDFISNITHEFKTPIATIGVALESIKDFNAIEDPKKTATYIDMSTQQLNKLNTMVEKLLETATLDSESLELTKEAFNIVDLTDTLVKKFKFQHTNKSLDFKTDSESLIVVADAFHLDNAINNILDNAIKYGGDTIEVIIKNTANTVHLSISDNGNSLTKHSKDNIFQKFYRVPKGNTHDVKGFGIGLYYTKKIIEKHNGSIDLDLSNAKTTFKISLPRE